jgi:hypothetical protein
MTSSQGISASLKERKSIFHRKDSPYGGIRKNGRKKGRSRIKTCLEIFGYASNNGFNNLAKSDHLVHPNKDNIIINESNKKRKMKRSNLPCRHNCCKKIDNSVDDSYKPILVSNNNEERLS